MTFNFLRRSQTLLLAFILLSGCASIVRPNFQTEIVKLRPGEYTLDPAHAALIFKVDHLELSTYVGRFNTFDATLDFDPDDLAATRLNGIVDMTSICLLYTSPSPRDQRGSRMPSSA